MTRVYVPATLPALAVLGTGGALPATRAYAVTPELRSLLALPEDGDGVEDELADAAVVAASDASLRLLVRQPDAPRRRVVVAADVDSADRTGDDDHPAAVDCPSGVSLSRVASVLVDDDDALPAVDAAVVAHATPHPLALEAALDALDEHVLSWFDVSELPALVGPLPAVGDPDSSRDGAAAR